VYLLAHQDLITLGELITGNHESCALREKASSDHQSTHTDTVFLVRLRVFRCVFGLPLRPGHPATFLFQPIFKIDMRSPAARKMRIR
jgi:hypothetical protein